MNSLNNGKPPLPKTKTILTQGQPVNGVFTSPPYAQQRKSQYGGVPVAEYVDWWEKVQANVREVLVNNGSFFINIKPHREKKQRVLYVFDLVLAMVRRWGWWYIDELVWTHQGLPGIYRPGFKNQFEPVYQFAGTEEPAIYRDNVAQPIIKNKLADPSPRQRLHLRRDLRTATNRFTTLPKMEICNLIQTR